MQCPVTECVVGVGGAEEEVDVKERESGISS